MGSGFSTAEIVRDRPAESVPTFKDVAADTTHSTEFRDLSARLVGLSPNPPTREELDTAYANVTTARAKQSKGGAERASYFSAEIDSTKKAAASFAAEAAQRAPKQMPDTTQPPSRGLRPFLATTKDEDPENAAMKLIQGIGLMATMIGGGRAGARASLSAWTGALQGWRAGDRERGDRAFADWRARNEELMERWETERRTYDMWLKAESLPIEQRMAGLKLDAMRNQNAGYAEEIDVRNAEAAVAGLEKRIESVLKHAEASARIIGMKETADDRLKNAREVQDRAFALKEQDAEKRIAASYTPTMSDAQLSNLAILEFNGGRPPTFGMGRSADRTRYNIVKSQVADTLGGPAAVAARQSMLGGLKQTQASVMKVQGLVEAFSETAAKNLRDADALSKRVDRTGSPMLNKWLLNGRKAWSGDPDVAEFDLAVRTAINETARVLNSANGNGVISDTARKEIEDMLFSAMTPEQFTRAVGRLHKEMENRRTSYADQIVALDAAIKKSASVPGQEPTAAPGAPGASSPGGKSRTITVNGKQVTVTEE